MNSNELLTKLGVSFTADGDFVYENGVGLVGRAIDREIAEVVEQRDGYARMAENEAASVQALSGQLAEAVGVAILALSILREFEEDKGRYTQLDRASRVLSAFIEKHGGSDG